MARMEVSLTAVYCREIVLTENCNSRWRLEAARRCS